MNWARAIGFTDSDGNWSGDIAEHPDFQEAMANPNFSHIRLVELQYGANKATRNFSKLRNAFHNIHAGSEKLLRGRQRLLLVSGLGLILTNLFQIVENPTWFAVTLLGFSSVFLLALVWTTLSIKTSETVRLTDEYQAAGISYGYLMGTICQEVFMRNCQSLNRVWHDGTEKPN